MATPSHRRQPAKQWGRAEATLTTTSTAGRRTSSPLSCFFCSQRGHTLAGCKAFKEKPAEERLAWITEQKRCLTCFSRWHEEKACPKRKPCGVQGCRSHHHPIVHQEPQPASQATVAVSTTPRRSQANKTVLLRVAPVEVSGPAGTVKTYALFDEASTVTLIDAKLASEVGAVGPVQPLTTTWTNATSHTDRNSRSVNISIKGKECTESFQMTGVRTTNDLALPSQSIDIKTTARWPHLDSLPLEGMREATPQLLIGQDNYHLIVPRQIHEGPPNAPVATQTKLGWIVHGNTGQFRNRLEPQYTCAIFSKYADEPLHQLVKESFALDALGTSPLVSAARRSKDEERAQDILETTTKRTADGHRWETGLLWRDGIAQLPESRASAEHRLYGMEKKLRNDRNLADLYCSKIKEYVEKGYCRKLSGEEAASNPPRTWYLPHFCVTNPNKPGKLRLVFDAAAKSNGMSLNDALLAGPDLLQPLTSVLYTFRERPVAFGGDIREMFHQVKIMEKDTPAQRFLWRDMACSSPPEVYQMEVMIFGAVSSPCSAQFAKNVNAQRFADTLPEAVDAILKKHYMDDYLDSADTELEAIRRVKEVIHIHEQGGFEMRNWISSSRRVLQAIPEHLRARGDIDLSSGTALPTERTLGVRWNPNDDCFVFSLSPAMRKAADEETLMTKRHLLRTVMSVFDPVGFLTCFTVSARMILQDVWRAGIGWDDELPATLRQKWINWCAELLQVTQIKIPRCYFGREKPKGDVELHVFVDASEKAYAAVAYLRASSDTDEHTTAFVSSRARVSPLKPVSIPRLELQAAVMGSRLANTVKQEHDLAINRTVFWSDSMTVLLWIRSDAHHYRPFVAHRIGEICEHTDPDAWRWVPSKDNPADLATRGARVGDLTPDSPWFKGPSFLAQDECDWPQKSAPASNSATVAASAAAEMKKLFIGTTSSNAAQPFHTSSLPDCKRFSSFTRLVRTTAWVLRFVQVLRSRVRKQPVTFRRLTADELAQAERLLVAQSQAESFPEEKRALNDGKAIGAASRLVQLHPVLDDGGLIRAKGRVFKAEALDQEARQPVILDNRHPLTALVIQQLHADGGHHGQERLINELRQRYWVLKTRSTVRKVTQACQVCKIQRAKPKAPEMAALPQCRLTPYVRPFTFTGMDYFGPMTVTVGRRHEKRYGVLFTCMTTRAVHLEIAASLTTDSAISAVRRLISRRGKPKEIFSDNGTNFRGADAELRRALQVDADTLGGELAGRAITWRFNPPAAPHMGGAWERLVRSVKVALRSQLKDSAPKEEVLHTFLCEAEAMVNSRPLTHVSIDADDEEALTPFHFLIGTSSIAGVAAPGVFTPTDAITRKQWRISQQMADKFWRRWLREYLPTLTRRTKWCQPVEPVQVNDVVIIVDSSLPRGRWPKGLVTAVHPGDDGVVRVVDVRTTNGGFRRPVTQVAKLDVRRVE